jgi:hypothetical protein
MNEQSPMGRRKTSKKLRLNGVRGEGGNFEQETRVGHLKGVSALAKQAIFQGFGVSKAIYATGSSPSGLTQGAKP